MKRRASEWISIHISKNPGKFLLLAILMFNIIFLIISALIISGLSLSGTENMPFYKAAFCTITMILDPGCVQFVVDDIGQMGVGIALVCLGIIFIGMITFTGAVIGYITNYISNFIESANAGGHGLKASNHFVILNWNTRASEIINDLLYCGKKETIVVLVNARKAEIEKEISDRISDTIEKENAEIARKYADSNALMRRIKTRFHRFRSKLTIVVREGDVFSSKQLGDISLGKAKIIIILGDDINDRVCKYEKKDLDETHSKGNSHTIKTLMQVADITASESSNDNQRIVVEITDNWTGDLVKKIIECKQVNQKCNIIPVNVNQILGQILSQFSLMPELNQAYCELFSNRGATFFAQKSPHCEDEVFIREYLKNHFHAIPLTHMKNSNGESYAYFSTCRTEDINIESSVEKSNYSVKINTDYWIEEKTVVILGHNSRLPDIMAGFCSFRSEWNHTDGSEILHITVIDDEEHLKKMNYFRDYPFVNKTVSANIYDRDLICKTIEDIVAANPEDTSILILSDDMAPSHDIDAQALANLVYVQDIINKRIIEDPDFDRESIDVIIEIIDPKHHDVVNSYSVNNVVISNRYISKMITQIGEKDALFEFYTDMLAYDESDESGGFESKEIYAKKVSNLFLEVPKPCSSDELIRAVFEASVGENIPEDKRYPTVVLGYVKANGKLILFEGNQTKTNVTLTEKDKLIIYSVH